MRKHGVDLLGSLSLLASLLCWATVPLFLRSFIHEIDGWTANGVRYPLSALIWLGPLLYFHRQGYVKRVYLKWALLPSAINIAGQSLWAWSPYYLEPAMMTFLVRISSLSAILGSLLLFRDEARLFRSAFFWAGLGACLVGFLGLTFLGKEIPHGSTITGIILITICGVFWGYYGVTVRWAMEGVHVLISFPIICVYTSIGTFVLMLMFGEPSRLLDMHAHRLLLLALSAVIGIAVAHIFFYKAIERLGVSISTGCQLLSPFVTAMGSYYIFREILTLGQWSSGTILLAGCGLLLYAQQRLHVVVHRGHAKETAPGSGSPEAVSPKADPNNSG